MEKCTCKGLHATAKLVGIKPRHVHYNHVTTPFNQDLVITP